MTVCALSLGSNVGNRLDSLRQAVALMKPLGEITGRSGVYDTAPCGVVEQPRFLNACVLLETDVPPEILLKKLQEIEQSVGRLKRERWGPREIDIDILIYGEEVINSEGLTVPHPMMHERAFVLVPLSEIAPDMKIPPDNSEVLDIAENINEKPGDDGIVFIAQL